MINRYDLYSMLENVLSFNEGEALDLDVVKGDIEAIRKFLSEVMRDIKRLESEINESIEQHEFDIRDKSSKWKV